MVCFWGVVYYVRCLEFSMIGKVGEVGLGEVREDCRCYVKVWFFFRAMGS